MAERTSTADPCGSQSQAVRIYSPAGEILAECDLADFLSVNDLDVDELKTLRDTGRLVIGGGASPAFVVVTVRPC